MARTATLREAGQRFCRSGVIAEEPISLGNRIGVPGLSVAVLTEVTVPGPDGPKPQPPALVRTYAVFPFGVNTILTG